MSLSSIDKIDDLFKYLYQKGSSYSKYRDIVKQHFNSSEKDNDIEGMLIKMAKDGFVDTGTFSTDSQKVGWVQETTYKLSFEGRLLYENSPKNKPYLSLKNKENRRKIWEITKIVAGIINALLVIGVAIWAALQSNS